MYKKYNTYENLQTNERGSWKILLWHVWKTNEQNCSSIFSKRPIDHLPSYPYISLHVLLRVRLTSIRDRVSIDSASRRGARQLKIMTFVWLLFEDQTHSSTSENCVAVSVLEKIALLAERKVKENWKERQKGGRKRKLVGRQCI